MTRVPTSNYTADADTQFQWATDDDDGYNRELDISYLARALERHTHASGRGVQIPADGIADGAVTVNKLGAGAVSTAKIADDAVTAAKIATDAVGAAEIVAGAVGTAELANDAVNAAKIAAGAVGTSELADDAVTAAKIAVLAAALEFAVGTGDKVSLYSTFAGLSIQTGKAILYANGGIQWYVADDAAGTNAREIQAGPIVTADIADNAVTEAKLDALDAPADGEVLAYDSATGRLEWVPQSSTSIPDNSLTVAKLEPLAKPLLGEIRMYGGSSEASVSPNGWKFCNGQAVSRATFAALFGAIGTQFGPGDGSTTFNLPNLLDRVPVGVGSGSTWTLGQQFGAASNNLDGHVHGLGGHTHPGPSHQHGSSVLGVSGNTGGMNAAGSAVQGGGGVNVGSHTHDQGTLDVTGNTDAAGTGTTGGPSTASNTTSGLDQVSAVQPSIGLNFIIYTGVAS